MPVGHLGRAALAAAFVTVAAPALGQDAGDVPDQSRPGPAGFMTRYAFHLNAAAIASDDPRFTWDSDIGGDVDLVDYGRGRLNFYANYNAVLGEERRAFELNQGSYTLDLRASLRAAANEVAVVFHHVSRHLVDRPRPDPIDWNMAGIEYWRRDALGRGRLELSARALAALRRSFVDYDWEVGGRINGTYPLGPRVSAIGGLSITGALVDRDVRGRANQVGARAEGGVHLAGRAGGADLFVAYERRIDAHPVDIGPRTWMLAGFRLLSR